jgi:hypothetical protein
MDSMAFGKNLAAHAVLFVCILLYILSFFVHTNELREDKFPNKLQIRYDLLEKDSR